MRRSGKRNVGTIVLASVFGLTIASAAHAELLLSPGFEDPSVTGDVAILGSGSPWSGWNNWVAPYSGYLSVAHPRTGSLGGKTFSGPNCGIYQSVGVAVGTNYAASAWFYNPSNDQIISAAVTQDVRLTFYASDGGQIGTPFVSTQLHPSTVVDAWTQLSVNAIAPAGAVSATFMMFMNNPEFGGGAMFVDDASLTAAAAPSIPGDYNHDGFVDAADYTVWADHFGLAGAGAPGDGNGDGHVDAADYTVWADHFGQGTPPGSLGVVPEPTTLGLAALAVPMLARRRRR